MSFWRTHLSMCTSGWRLIRTRCNVSRTSKVHCSPLWTVRRCVVRPTSVSTPAITHSTTVTTCARTASAHCRGYVPSPRRRLGARRAMWNSIVKAMSRRTRRFLRLSLWLNLRFLSVVFPLTLLLRSTQLLALPLLVLRSPRVPWRALQALHLHASQSAEPHSMRSCSALDMRPMISHRSCWRNVLAIRSVIDTHIVCFAIVLCSLLRTVSVGVRRVVLLPMMPPTV
mmetsp:Transcript_284/g.837  ORF Transcript_284/g.837 Transcript_284/m.837 type:complete len:227 (+) Transcript_284:780-1460(+)